MLFDFFYEYKKNNFEGSLLNWNQMQTKEANADAKARFINKLHKFFSPLSIPENTPYTRKTLRVSVFTKFSKVCTFKLCTVI